MRTLIATVFNWAAGATSLAALLGLGLAEGLRGEPVRAILAAARDLLAAHSP